MADLDQAAREIAAELNPEPALRDLAKSQRMLAQAFAKSRGYDPALDEEEDEISAQFEDDHDEYDQEEDEDQDPDNPDLGSGIDDLRGVVGSPKKHRRAYAEKSRRRHPVEEAEERLMRARERLRRAAEAERDAEEADDADRLEEARKRREAAEHELERARKVHRAVLERARKNNVPEDRPAWAGDEAEFEGDRRRRQRVADEWYSDAEGAYFTNEDADHEEDAAVPPDGPDVGDGDDTDVYTIGAHKVRSARAMRRSRRVMSREDLYKSVAARGRITEDTLDAAPALEELLEILGDQQDLLAKSVRHLDRQDDRIHVLARAVYAQGRALQQFGKSLQAVLKQPVMDPTKIGFPPGFNVLLGGQAKKTSKLQKSRQDLIVEAEQALRAGLIDVNQFQTIGRLGTPEEIVAAVPEPVARQLGWK
ncbi:MAG: hypothetical protein K6V97_03905 [Actinomycetia bacterium]|nr:hypothetical protein [Actinomycetes bacterium]